MSIGNRYKINKSGVMRTKFARGSLVCGGDMFHSPIISYPLEEPYINI